jgi:hypothetical protein
VSREIRKAVAYLRTSSRTNVGADKDSDKRQRAAIEAYADWRREAEKVSAALTLWFRRRS